MKITGTFLDEISHDIPHQNWGYEEWDADFRAMKHIGIDTVIMIRCGHRRWMTFPSEVLSRDAKCFTPPVDLVDLFLELAEKYGMKFYFGTYDSGLWQEPERMQAEKTLHKRLMEEVWARYGQRRAFAGWYLTLEMSRRMPHVVELLTENGKYCKALSGNLPVMISPFIDGAKAVSAFSAALARNDAPTIEQHVKVWNEILSGLKGTVDVMAFQDGHCDYGELAEYMAANKELADAYGMHCWTNCESFDRDMPIKFLPIKWEKMLLKLEAARVSGMEKAITFEFSHFMSPNSCYPQAHGLYRRYCEHFNLLPR